MHKVSSHYLASLVRRKSRLLTLQTCFTMVSTPQKYSYPVIFAQSGKRIEPTSQSNQRAVCTCTPSWPSSALTKWRYQSLPNIGTFVKICPAIPIGTTSVERSFSQMKVMKTRLRNRIGQSSPLYLMKIAMEIVQILTDKDLKNIVNMWNRKAMRFAVWIVTIRYNDNLCFRVYYYWHSSSSKKAVITTFFNSKGGAAGFQGGQMTSPKWNLGPYDLKSSRYCTHGYWKLWNLNYSDTLPRLLKPQLFRRFAYVVEYMHTLISNLGLLNSQLSDCFASSQLVQIIDVTCIHTHAILIRE